MCAILVFESTYCAKTFMQSSYAGLLDITLVECMGTSEMSFNFNFIVEKSDSFVLYCSVW